MAGLIVTQVEKKGRISVEAAQAEYRRLVKGAWAHHKPEVDAKLIAHGHADYIPED